MGLWSVTWSRTRLFVLHRDQFTCRMLLDHDGQPLPDQSDRTAGREHGIRLTTTPPSAPTHATADHVVARAVWPDGTPGRDDPANLQAACRRCNSRRSARIVNAARAVPINASRDWWS